MHLFIKICGAINNYLFLPQINYNKEGIKTWKYQSTWIQRIIVGEKSDIRESLSISMEELAERSGLAVEQIERIENNVDIPSLAPLIKLARVLGVRLGTFLDDQDETGPVICRKKEAKETISFSNNAIHSRRHMEYRSLSKSKADRHMEPFMIDIAPTKDSDFILSSTEGEDSSWSWKALWK